MSSTTIAKDADERTPLYQYVFYGVAGAAAVVAVVAFSVLSLRPLAAGPAEGIGLTAAIVAVVTTAATLVYGRNEKTDRNADRRAVRDEENRELRAEAVKQGQETINRGLANVEQTMAQAMRRLGKVDETLSQISDDLKNADEATARGLAFGEQVVAMLRQIIGLLDRLVASDRADDEVRQQVKELHKRLEELTAIAALGDDGGGVGPAWLAEFREDIDAISNPGVTDLSPLLHLRALADRLRKAEG